MTAISLSPTTFGGNNINDGSTYRAYFVIGSNTLLDRYDAKALETERPEHFPTYVRHEPLSRRIDIEIQIPSFSRANIETLKQWFSPQLGQQYLVASPESGGDRRIYCFPERFYAVNETTYRVQLLASSAYWEEVTGAGTNNGVDQAIVGTAQTFVAQNLGNEKTPLKLVIKPTTVKGHADDYVRRRRILIANRSPLAVSDPVGDGWPVNIAGTTLDTDAINTAGHLQTDLDDLRVVLDGQQINRWPDPATDDPASRIWANLQFPPAISVTLPAFASNVSPAKGATVVTTNVLGTTLLPRSGFLLFGTECIHYTKVSPDDGLSIVLSSADGRGARHTTAAAHAAATWYWVAHPFLDLMYDNSGVTSPLPPDDRKPMIDLTNSTNASFKWAAGFLQSGRRSGCWQPEWTDEGATALYIRCYETGGGVVFDDAIPVAAKPNFNNLIMDSPYGIKAAAAAVTLDLTVNNTMRLRGYLTDLSGYETLLINEEPQAIATGQAYQPGAISSRLRLNGRNGALTGIRAAVSPGGNYQTLSNAVYMSMSFRLTDDADVVGFVGYFDKNSTTGDVKVVIYEDSSGVRGNALTNTTTLIGTLTSASLTNGGAWTACLFAASVRLRAGLYHLGLEGATASRPNWGMSVYHEAYENYFVDGSNAIAKGTLPLAFILTALTDAQDDAPVASGDLITLDNIILNWDDATPQTPLIVVGAEEAATFYLADMTLKNMTSGQQVTFYFPMTLNQTLTLDSDARTLTDDETGEQIPFAATLSDWADWLQLSPGNNTIEHDEAGVAAVTVTPSWKARWN